MTSSQFAEWMVYDNIEPFGEYRAELRHGQKMAQYSNYHPYEGYEPKSPLDFMNFTERPTITAAATPEENFARIDKELFGM